jgi:hypothetical protein
VNEELVSLAQPVTQTFEGDALRINMADAIYDGRSLILTWTLYHSPFISAIRLVRVFVLWPSHRKEALQAAASTGGDNAKGQKNHQDIAALGG